MRTNSSLLSRIEALEKRINSRPKKRTKADEAALYAEAEELLRKFREERRESREEWEREYAERLKWNATPTVVEPALEVEESLDDFEAWLGGVQDED
ncbi:MAG: hypothetical protein CLLPBCKN_001361 [Chroococcidiopsis cubana SAG 39.79]|uniref:Uncharacterized protein n=1 Tax=Chroococcidiopsis cubana SAG 39.79 TaxID=388085 RepID=A0AB37U7J4_9CYAN|nr:hypothetical protein [Chroococcidiopsis cubana]MDZ4871973.1 hypothetical protein [Chroococcidiopsis cubana SAG 39.79]PSB56140.1 hypothetical protein C7B79_32535 [Chroococcidiopsis cubana CCALA 043]RUS94406.1 hypothetical protein DSM107010_71940 [Chroococcidiopsis cubana SAG 39.79]